jgi:hypothetical protein
MASSQMWVAFSSSFRSLLLSDLPLQGDHWELMECYTALWLPPPPIEPAALSERTRRKERIETDKSSCFKAKRLSLSLSLSLVLTV